MSHVFEVTVDLASPIDEVFHFFSVAENLNLLTPANLKFKILTPQPIVMRVGTIIDYQIRLRGIPMNWRTEITEWEPGRKFADNQLKGPYKKWHHTHSFEPIDGGTRMHDRVEYDLPFGVLGELVHPFIRRDVERIFGYRTQVISDRFRPLERN